MKFKIVMLSTFLAIGFGALEAQASTTAQQQGQDNRPIQEAQTQNDKNEKDVWEETLTKVIGLRQKLLNEYNECLAKADGNETLENVCAESLRAGGKELDDMRDGTGAYAPATKEVKNVYNPSEEDKRKDKKLSECFDKTEGKPECYHKFEDLNATAYEEYVNSIPNPGKK